jgi:tRNA nucleotidyltransferase (CCA-adding enzyme)
MTIFPFYRSNDKAILFSMQREVLKVCEAVSKAGGRAMIVGGWVRDRLLGIESKDYDIEVYRMEPSILRDALAKIAPVNTVGEKFSVYKLAFKSQEGERFEIDVSIPRRESKTGRGHRRFLIEGDPDMTFEEAARRRDFTINAILYDPLTDEIIDPFGGVEDLKRRALKAVAADTFIDDSLRVLRAVQFAARFEMTIDPQTVDLCRSIDLSDLPRERIWGEMEKLLTLASRPSIGLDAALAVGALASLLPEIHALAEVESRAVPDQSPFHITKRALDEAAKLAIGLSKEKRVALMLAVLCRELGNPQSGNPQSGKLQSENLQSENPESGKPLQAVAADEARSVVEIAVEQTRALLNRLGVHTMSGYDVRSQTLALARERLKPIEFYRQRDSAPDGLFRRLARRVDIDLLYRAEKACALARGDSTVAEDWFIEKARALGVEHGPPAPLLLGRHLIEAGLAPGPRMGELLRRIYDLQLDGQINTLEEALQAALDLR